MILAEEPTQGVDVGARFDIYEALRAKAEEGIAAVVKSSDPIELSGLCDRVIVMSRGRIVEEIPRHELGERRIVEAIVGSRRGRHGGRRRERRNAHVKRGWLPLVLMTALIVALGAYTAAHQSAFLSKENLNSLLLESLPLDPRLAGPGGRAPRRRLRRLGRRPHDDVRRRRVVHAAATTTGASRWCRARSPSSAWGSRSVSSMRS